jgi:CRISPR system Cascade subunit CasD
VPTLNTILSRRDYRSGAWHLGALWSRGEAARWPLEVLAEAMERPGFVPYLGRKSCPLGLPLAPCITEAVDAPTALLARHSEGPEARLEHPQGRNLRAALADAPGETIIVLDAADADPNDPRLRRIELRRDQPRSRRRWQFDLRQEAVLGVPPS